MGNRDFLKDKKRIVIKVGSSSLQHEETGGLDYTKLDVLVREIADLKNMGKDVVLVSSGAIAVGKRAVHMDVIKHEDEGKEIAVKQACAAIGQARLMMVYQLSLTHGSAMISIIFSLTPHDYMILISSSNSYHWT